MKIFLSDNEKEALHFPLQIVFEKYAQKVEGGWEIENAPSEVLSRLPSDIVVHAIDKADMMES